MCTCAHCPISGTREGKEKKTSLHSSHTYNNAHHLPTLCHTCFSSSNDYVRKLRYYCEKQLCEKRIWRYQSLPTPWQKRTWQLGCFHCIYHHYLQIQTDKIMKEEQRQCMELKFRRDVASIKCWAWDGVKTRRLFNNTLLAPKATTWETKKMVGKETKNVGTQQRWRQCSLHTIFRRPRTLRSRGLLTTQIRTSVQSDIQTK